MIRNALIALYILVVLAISAVSRAASPVLVVKPNRPMGAIVNPKFVDPLPGFGSFATPQTKMLSIGNREVSK